MRSSQLIFVFLLLCYATIFLSSLLIFGGLLRTFAFDVLTLLEGFIIYVCKMQLINKGTEGQWHVDHLRQTSPNSFFGKPRSSFDISI